MVVKKGGLVKKIAEERIQILYRLAKEAHKTDPKLSTRYARLIGQISRHYKIRLEKSIRRGICRKCGSVLIPGSTLSVRLVSSNKSILYKCMNCGNETRIPY
jgi:ribonuclease P protein subunit RPR2